MPNGYRYPENHGVRRDVVHLTMEQQAAVKILKALELHGATEYGALRNARLGPHLRHAFRPALISLLADGHVVTTRRYDERGYRTVYLRGTGLPAWLGEDLYDRLLHAHTVNRSAAATSGGRWT